MLNKFNSCWYGEWGDEYSELGSIDSISLINLNVLSIILGIDLRISRFVIKVNTIL